ncbi:NUDIX hydrolase [Desemzia sp. FAM 23991]|uniref:NUDIX hydrolase n=1 Tax=unclassified Desemzia TaxID=2685243 RepID=UPI003883EDCB
MLENIQHFFSEYQPKALHVKREYAVLIPIIMVKGFPHILYEVRSQHISQPGDTSFPGGKVELGESYQEAAVRETIEELQIPGESIQVIGEMDFIVQNNSIIHSFIGEIKGIDIKDIVWNEEVAEVYTVPLRYFMKNEPDYYSVDMMMNYPKDFPYDRIPNGKNYKFRHARNQIAFYNLDDHYLWGFTASLTQRLISLVKEHHLLDN